MNIDGRLASLCVVAAVGGGVISTVMLTSALAPRPIPAPVPAAYSMSAQISRIAKSVRALEDSLARIASRLPGSREASSAIAEQREYIKPEAEVGIASPQPRGRGRSQQNPAHWVAVLDKDISRVLVERGLTPFDSRLGELVRDASNAVRKVDEEYNRGIADHRASLLSGQLAVGDYHRLTAPMKAERQGRRKAITNKLAVAVDK